METKEQVLKDIKNYICNDFLNTHDPSVGIYGVYEIEKWVIDEINDTDGIKVISYDTNTVLLDCEICKIEIFKNGYKWDARIVQ